MFQDADHVCIPLLDGKVSVAQVAGLAPGRLLLLLTRRHRPVGEPVQPFSKQEVIANRVVDISDLGEGRWPVAGFAAVPRVAGLPDWPPPPDQPADDPTVIEAFVNACLGLYPWDGFVTPDFFDHMLRPGLSKPEAARTKRQMDIT